VIIIYLFICDIFLLDVNTAVQKLLFCHCGTWKRFVECAQ